MRLQKKKRRELHAGRREKKEIAKRSIESILKLSDHAVDCFLVSPGNYVIMPSPAVHARCRLVDFSS